MEERLFCYGCNKYHPAGTEGELRWQNPQRLRGRPPWLLFQSAGLQMIHITSGQNLGTASGGQARKTNSNSCFTRWFAGRKSLWLTLSTPWLQIGLKLGSGMCRATRVIGFIFFGMWSGHNGEEFGNTVGYQNVWPSSHSTRSKFTGNFKCRKCCQNITIF